jgi:hypothetical protein
MDSIACLVPPPAVASVATPSLAVTSRNWTKAIGPILSVGVLAVVWTNVNRTGFANGIGRLPIAPGFWLFFLLFYCATPLAEWVVYRRLWSIPVSGFSALLRKQISNELLFDYLGEVQFYAWARHKLEMTTAPFGAIKDVAIVSAICGSALALAMLSLLGGLLQQLSLGIGRAPLAGSALLVIATIVAPLIFRPRLFSLPSRELWFIAKVQLVRIAAIFLLSAWLWHMVLPDIALGWWFLLAAVRQLVSRLPLLPNKDVLFVGVADFVLGQQSHITHLLLVFASVTLAIHMLVAAAFGLRDLIAWVQRP